MKRVRLAGLCLGVSASLCAGVANAALVVTGDTTGSDNQTTAGFYGVAVTGTTGEFVSSVTYDLSVDPGSFFDFDGDATFNNATAPVIATGSLTGLTGGDISFSFLGNQPTSLTINFAPNTFGAGDSFRFGADTDFLGTDPAPGSVFGDAAVPLRVTFQGGGTSSAPFVTTIPGQQSRVVVPEPGGAAVFAAAVGGLAVRRRRGR